MAVPGTRDAAWAAPDTGSTSPGPVIHPVSAPDAAAFAPHPEASVPRLMPLRPMTVADVLDGAVAVIKAAPRTVFTIAAAVLVPVELLTAFLQRDTLADRGVSGVLSTATSTTGPVVDVSWTALIAFVLAGVSLAMVTAAVARLVGAWYAEQDLPAGAALTGALRSLPALTVAWLVVHVLEIASLAALAIGLLFLAPLLAVTVPALATEQLGPFRSIRRSMRLVGRRYWWVLWESLLIGVVAVLLTVALSGVSIIFRIFEWGWIVDAFCLAAASLVTVPFVAAAITLVYLDLRVRSEGLDLELAAAAQFETAVPASPAEVP